MINMLNQKFGKFAVAALILSAIFLTGITVAALTASQNVPLSGTITAVNVELYTDSACTIPCTSLAVGTVSPGGTATQTLYVKNTGTVPETLSMTATNWNPANADSYLAVTWNRANHILNAGASVQAIITLTAAANTGTLTTFSCTVTITGTQ